MEASVMVTANSSLVLKPYSSARAFLNTSFSSLLSNNLQQQQHKVLGLLTHKTRRHVVVKRKRTCCKAAIKEVDESQFSEVVLQSDRPVLVEFVATWCGPCRLVAPSIDALAQEYKDRITVVKIDHDANPNLIKEYEVYGLPALILFKNGQPVPDSKREGAITKAKLKEYIDALLESLPVA